METGTLKEREPRFWWRGDSAEKAACTLPPRRGALCPACRRDRLDYNPQFLLACPACGHVAETGAFT